MTDTIAIEVAYALPDTQRIVAVDVPVGATALDAVKQSGIEQFFDELTISDDLKLGVFGKAVSASHVLSVGERIEIYRPLKIDPKEVRKQRAAKAKADKNADDEPGAVD
jgi:putative ubiquitin-RnfH superfamily antitoxin RatB of RatAB toxin-antitoxin module